MNAPVLSLRIIFALGTFACSLVLVLFVHGRAQWTPEFWLQFLATSVAICAAVCFVAFRQGKMRVINVPLGVFARVFLRQLLFSYIASAIAVTVIALAVVYPMTHSAENSLALAALAGFWLALWLAPTIASVISWLKLRPASTNDKSPE